MGLKLSERRSENVEEQNQAQQRHAEFMFAQHPYASMFGIIPDYEVPEFRSPPGGSGPLDLNDFFIAMKELIADPDRNWSTKAKHDPYADIMEWIRKGEEMVPVIPAITNKKDIDLMLYNMLAGLKDFKEHGIVEGGPKSPRREEGRTK